MAGTDHRHAKDVGKILLGALQDLKHIRGELDGSHRGPGGDAVPAAAVIDSVIARTEADLRAKAEELSDVIMRGEQTAQLTYRMEKLDAYAADGQPMHATAAGGAGAYSGGGGRGAHAFGGATSTQKDRFNGGADALSRDGQAVNNMLTRPSDMAAREYLEGRYGVPAPKPSKPREAVPGATVAEQRKHIKSAITVQAGAILPKALRLDPFAEKPRLTDADVSNTGVYDLANRGYLDPLTDLNVTLASGPDGHPMRAEAARVMPARLRDATLRQPAAAGWESHDMLGVKLDLTGDDGGKLGNPPNIPPPYHSSYQDYKGGQPQQRARHRVQQPPGGGGGAGSNEPSHMQRRKTPLPPLDHPAGAESPPGAGWGNAGWDDAGEGGGGLGGFASTSHLGRVVLSTTPLTTHGVPLVLKPLVYGYLPSPPPPPPPPSLSSVFTSVTANV